MNYLNKSLALLFISSLLLSITSTAQRIDIDKKALSFLTSEKIINTQFYYNNLEIDGEITEAFFLEKMQTKITSHSNEAEAKQWLDSYYEHKSTIWGNSFISELNERLNDLTFVENDNTPKYTMKVSVAWMYFGYDAGIIDQPAKVTLHVDFVETSNPEVILFSTQIKRAMGTYNKTKGDGEGKGPSLNRMRKAFMFGAYKFAQALKRVVD